MINPEVLSYIRSQVALGVSRDAIKKALATGGWSEADMTEAFAAIDGIQKPPPPLPLAPITPLPPITTNAAPRGLRDDALPSTAPRPMSPVTPTMPSQPFIARPVPSMATISTAPVRRRSLVPWMLLILILLIAGSAVLIYAMDPSLFEKYFGAPVAPAVQQTAPTSTPIENTTINIPIINVPAATSTATSTAATTTTTTTTTATTTTTTSTSTAQ